MINYDEFIECYYPSVTISRRNSIKSFLNNVTEVVGNKPIEEALKNKLTLCDIFYIQKSGNMSRSHYQKIKEYLINLFDFLGIQAIIPTREEVLNSLDNIYYFRGINEMLNFIDEVGEHVLPYYNPTADLVRVKSICVLGWLGFTIEEIVNLKKSNLSLVGCNGYRLSNKHGTFEIFDAPFAALYYLSELNEYKGIPSGKKIVLKSNEEYLFRSQNITREKLDALTIAVILKRFNSCIPSSRHIQILFRNLHKNALFIEIYNDISNRSLMEKITDIMKCDYKVGLSYKEQYNKFVTLLKNNEI